MRTMCRSTSARAAATQPPPADRWRKVAARQGGGAVEGQDQGSRIKKWGTTNGAGRAEGLRGGVLAYLEAGSGFRGGFGLAQEAGGDPGGAVLFAPVVHGASVLALGGGQPVLDRSSRLFTGRTPTVGPDSPVNLSRIVLSPHAGAHADAPLHCDSTGEAAGALDREPFLGPCLVIHALGEPFVEVGHLEPHAARLEPRILVRSYARRPAAEFDHDLPAFRPAALEWIADRGVRLIGTDSASVDPAGSRTLDAHQVLRRRGLRVLENLHLDDVPEGRYELIALPVRLTEAEAAPVRAVLREVPG